MESNSGRPFGGWQDEEETEVGEEGVLSPTQIRAGAAVEQLLNEVEAETEPRGLLSVGGLRGRVAIVTGGSTGIGRAITHALARSGAHIAFNYMARDDAEAADAEATVAELESVGVRVLARKVDSGDSEGVNAFVADVLTTLGGLHVLVNNSGVGRDRALWRMTDQDWEEVIRTNLTGAFYFTRAVAPHFRKQEFGKIVNISSVHAFRSEFGLANYAASKAGLLALTRSSALELGPSNVNVNAVAPGYIRTTRLTDRVPSEILDRAREESALGRLGDPQDVAGAVLFLCSEAARHITGAVLPVDGGHLL
jgi:3-oxoacyl-[acyl-carrier protein] reductase